MTRWTDESAMGQWINDSVSRRFSGSMNPCTSELVSRWTNETVNQWISDPLIQWTTEPMNQWIRGSFEPLDEGMDGWWMDERTNERTNEWMDSDLFAWGTSSLSYFFSEQPRIWATSALSCLPASSFAASATQFFSSRSRFNTLSSLQLQSRIAQE